MLHCLDLQVCEQMVDGLLPAVVREQFAELQAHEMVVQVARSSQHLLAQTGDE